jgi:hypothetical protein
MKTRADIDYRAAPYPQSIATIPAGTPVIPASNLPSGGYWVQPWPGMSASAESWQHNYGFLINDDEVTP